MVGRSSTFFAFACCIKPETSKLKFEFSKSRTLCEIKQATPNSQQFQKFMLVDSFRYHLIAYSELIIFFRTRREYAEARNIILKNISLNISPVNVNIICLPNISSGCAEMYLQSP